MHIHNIKNIAIYIRTCKFNIVIVVMEVSENNNIDVLIEEPLGDIHRMYVSM